MDSRRNNSASIIKSEEIHKPPLPGTAQTLQDSKHGNSRYSSRASDEVNFLDVGEAFSPRSKNHVAV